MNQKNQIGLAPEETGTLANKMNDLLANYPVFYMNVRWFHWNIRGDKFFELHAKFEELYTDALVKIDEMVSALLPWVIRRCTVTQTTSKSQRSRNTPAFQMA